MAHIKSIGQLLDDLSVATETYANRINQILDQELPDRDARALGAMMTLANAHGVAIGDIVDTMRAIASRLGMNDLLDGPGIELAD